MNNDSEIQDVEVDLDLSQVSEVELNRLSKIDFSGWAEKISSAK